MNRVFLIGRLTKDPETRYTQGETATAVSRYSLAVDRVKDGADFINCVAFGKNGEFAEKYLKKGNKIAIEGRIQTGSYNNKDGNKVFTTDIVVERHEFCESKGQSAQSTQAETDEFMQIPDGMEELPFA